MTRKVYKRIGLRRDKNFGDLSSSTASLNNLLDGLVDSGGSFLSQDLNAIRNISNVGLTNSQYLKVVGSTTKYTTSSGDNLAFKPQITYQNRIDKFTVFSGEPRIQGGNGLTAKYWQKDQIVHNQENASEGKQFEYWQNTNSTASEVLTGVTTMGQLPSDNFWEKGDFDWTGKLHPQSVLTDGGVSWEGYFVPTRTGPHHFNFHTTGYLTVDWNLNGYEEDLDGNQTAESITAVGAGNTYTEYLRVGVTTSFDGNTASANSNTLTIKANFEKTIGIGMSVSGTGIKSVTSGGITRWPTIEEVTSVQDGTTTNITLKPVVGETNSIGTSNITTGTELTFSRNLGQDIQPRFKTPYLIEFKKYRFRIRFFYPKDIDTQKLQRKLNIDWWLQGTGESDLYYYRLYALDYKFQETEKGRFNQFFDTSVKFGGTDPIGIGGTLPIGGGTNFGGDEPYVRINTSNKVHAKYSPKTTLAGILRATPKAWNSTNGSVVLECTDTTGGIEVGNYVFGTDNTMIEEGTRVADIIINEAIIIDKPAKSTTTQNLSFYNHRGFVKRVKGAATASGGSTVNFASPYKTDNTDLWGTTVKKGMIVLTTKQGGGDVNAYTRITEVDESSDNTIILNSGMTNSSNTLIYIYESRGLLDRSLEAFCPQSGNTRTRCHLLPTNRDLDGDGTAEAYIAASGQDVIQLVTITGLTAGLTVEGTGIPSGTTIDSFPPGGASIKLTNDLTKNINGGATVTIHGLSGNRQLCCPPTDTSPPFEATSNGLMSTDDESDLEFTQGNAKFDELRIKFPNTLPSETDTSNNGKVKKYDTSDTVDRKLHIRTAGTPDQSNGLFYILGSTT